MNPKLKLESSLGGVVNGRTASRRNTSRVWCGLWVIALLFFGVSQTLADVRPGLVSYWPLDVDNGGTTSDVSFGNDMTLFNAPTVSTGQRSNAFTFNGTSQYLQRTHGLVPEVDGMPINLSPGGFTIAMWVKGNPQTAANRTVFYLGNTANNTPVYWLEADSVASGTKLAVFIRTSGNATLLNHVRSTNVVWDNAWHHIAWVDDNGSARLYVDGAIDPQNFNYSPMPARPFAFNSTSIGAQITTTVPNRYFNGSIDDVALWERTLTQAEIQDVMTNGIPTPVSQSGPTVVKPLAGSTNVLGSRVYLAPVIVGTHPFSYQWFRDGVEQVGQTVSTLVLNDLTTPGTNNITVIATGAGPAGPVTNSAPLVILPDPAANVTNGLVSYWPLDATNTPTTTPDLYSHFDMTLTAMDSNNIVSGQYSNAFSFDGTAEYLKRTGGSCIYSVTNYSISFWVNAGVGNNRTVFGEGLSTLANPALNFTTDVGGFFDTMNVFIRNDAGIPWINNVRTTQSVFNNVWHHIVWTDQNGVARLYVDGVLDATEFGYVRTPTTVNTTAIGALIRNTINPLLNGLADDVATWNRRLTWTEIQQIRTNGIPAPVVPLQPTIVFQPLDQTNGVFSGDTVSFSVTATGDNPLSYQWRSNNVNIPIASNASAGTDVLTLTNVQPAASAGYAVVITNVAGAITSHVAQLLVVPYTPQTTGVVLNLDWGLTGTPDLMPGFTEMNLGMNGTNFNGVKITVAAIGGAVVERHRVAPDDITNAPPLFTQAQIYNDLVANSSTVDGTGMNVLIERLAPNTKYGLMIWSWSTLAPLDRISDWVETASGSPVTIKSNYVYNTPNAPTNDFDRTFGALLTSSASGKLQLEGYKNGGTGSAVFINALRLVAQPSIRITDARLINGNIRLSIETQYPDQPISIEEKSDITGTWGTATGGGITETHGPMVTAEFSASADRRFYRVSSP